MTPSHSTIRRNEAVKAKIVEAADNPKMRYQWNKSRRTKEAFSYPLGLEDVLRTLRETIEENGSAQDELIYRYWTLGLSFDDQPQETKDFLYSVLCSR